MKYPSTLAGVYVVLALAGARLVAAEGPITIEGLLASGEPVYLEAERRAEYKVVKSVTVATNGLGETILKTNQAYIALAAGMHYQDQGVWKESREWIQILPEGGAAALELPHKAYFPSDIYEGSINLITPDGKSLESRPLGLSLFDGENSVLIAELTNSVGLILPPGNQVIYTNAFSGIRADLRYTCTRAGFEQDIILREQPPPPADFGLDPNTTRLQVLTEFLSPPQPSLRSGVLPPQSGVALRDQIVDFGAMKIGQGRSFLLGTNAPPASACIAKEWIALSGRQCLVEEIPLPALQVESLPPFSALNYTKGDRQVATKQSRLPEVPAASASRKSRPMQTTKLDLEGPGLVIDYVLLNVSTNNFTFRGDTTYYIEGPLNLSGTTVFEGGAVIKYTNNASLNISYPGRLECLGDAYRPTIFTARDDNSVGETLPGATNSLSPYTHYANPAVGYIGSYGGNDGFNLSHFRICYAEKAVQFWAISLTNAIFDNGQIVNCHYGLYTSGQGSVSINNVLFSKFQVAVFANYATIRARHATFDAMGTTPLLETTSPYTVQFLATNCILISFNTFAPPGTLTGDYNGFYNCSTAGTFGAHPIVTGEYPFKPVGAGSYYLSEAGEFRDAGTTNIDGSVLQQIRKRTTEAPIVLSSAISQDTCLSPMAQRDTDMPDLGYHYEVLDWAASQISIESGKTLTLTNGVAVGIYGGCGFELKAGSRLSSTGRPENLNRLVACNLVQERPDLWGNPLTKICDISSSYPYSFRCSFTDFSMPPVVSGQAGLLPATEYSPEHFSLADCWLRGVALDFYPDAGAARTTILLRNNYFERCSIDLSGYGNYSGPPSAMLCCTNNLFRGGSLALTYDENGYGTADEWGVCNNAFDATTASKGGSLANLIKSHHNAYTNGATVLAGLNNRFVSAFHYTNSFFGNYYQANTWLCDTGSTTADLLQLFHHTTQTTHAKETNSIVDIGFHYVAIDGMTGQPFDLDGDGMPDYLEDANGNGEVDAGETSWTNYNSANGLGSGMAFQVFTPLK